MKYTATSILVSLVAAVSANDMVVPPPVVVAQPVPVAPLIVSGYYGGYYGGKGGKGSYYGGYYGGKGGK